MKTEQADKTNKALTPDLRHKIDAYWQAANYLSVGQIYHFDKLVLKRLMEQRVIFVFPHDRIALGEDGSTHQPVGQLASLREIPNLLVIRQWVCQRALASLQRNHG